MYKTMFIRYNLFKVLYVPVLILTLIFVLISIAVATDINKSLLYSRTLIIGLLCTICITLNSIYIKPLNLTLGLYNGFYNVNILNQYFNVFVLCLSCLIAFLSAFFPRKIYNIYSSNLKSRPISLEKKQDGENGYEIPEQDADGNKNDSNNKSTEIESKYLVNLILNKNALQFTIIEYSLIILFILCGAILLMSTGDLLSLFLSIELQSYGLYIISTIYRDSESATSSGLTYFLLGGMSSCFILLGSAILYVNSGNTSLDNIFVLNSIKELTFLRENFLYTDNLIFSLFGNLNYYKIDYVNFSLIILVVGLLFKISAAPFHFWSPDVYDGIPTIVTTFVAIIAKVSLLIIMLELVSYTNIISDNIETSVVLSNVELNHNTSYEWKNIILLSSLMSLVIGSILGLTQYRIKRLFAYSTISHVGFILLALSVNKIESVQGYIFYIFQYSLSNLNAFFVLITIGYTLREYFIKASDEKGNRQENKPKALENHYKDKYIDIENSPVQILNQIKGYFHVNSYLSLSFAITLFSFVGIPPLIGFFAKQMVLSAALDQGYIFITLVAIITSVVAAAYYLNIIKLIFFTSSDYVKKNNNILCNAVLSTNYTSYINDKLSIIISFLTMLILLFIFMPDEWFKIVSILSLSVNKV